jgi:hypothetical protein
MAFFDLSSVSAAKIDKKLLVFSNFEHNNLTKEQNNCHIRNQHKKLRRITYFPAKFFFRQNTPRGDHRRNFWGKGLRGSTGVFWRKKNFAGKYVIRRSFLCWFRIWQLFCSLIKLWRSNLPKTSDFLSNFATKTELRSKNDIFSKIKHSVKKLNRYCESPSFSGSNEVRQLALSLHTKD